MDKSYIVYRHLNKVNGKCYIGITGNENPNCRWKYGKGYKQHKHFYRAILKYGWDNFEHIILESGLTAEEAFEREKYYIKYYNSRNSDCGYNGTDGGEGTPGKTVTEETRRKLREAGKKRVVTAETRNRLSIAGKGRIVTEETRRKLSEINKGRKVTEKTRKKISEANKGRKLSKEHIEKLRESNMGRKHTEEEIQHLREINTGVNSPSYGKHLSEETRRKLSDAGKGRKHNPQTKLKMSLNNNNTSSVICLNTGRIYRTVTEAAKDIGINGSGISRCAAGKQKTAGKDKSGVPLKWSYYKNE